MYAFFQKYLQPVSKADIAERDYKPLTRDELTVWTKDHPAPKPGADVEVALLQEMQKQGDAAVKAAKPEEIAAAFRTMVGYRSQEPISMPKYAPEIVEFFKDKPTLITVSAHQEKEPDARDMSIRDMHDIGYAFAVSNVVDDDTVHTSPLRVKNDRDYAGFTYGYNHSIFAYRANKLAEYILKIKHLIGDKQPLILRAQPGAEHWALAAALVVGDKIAVIDLRSTDFRFSKLTAYDDADFWPGAVKYGDLPGLLRCQIVPVLIARSAAAEKLVNEIKHDGLRVEFYDPFYDAAKPMEFLRALERVQKKK